MALTGDTLDFVQGGIVTSSAQLVDSAATVGDVLTVQADKSIAAAPGGGSQPGALQFASLTFTETAGTGTYTATLPIAAGTTLAGIWAYVTAVWAAEHAALSIGDSFDPIAYFDGSQIDIGSADSLALTTPWNGTGNNSPADSDYLNVALGTPNRYVDASVFDDATNTAPGVPYPIADTLTAKVVTTGTTGTTGRLVVRVAYYTAPTPSAAVKS